MTTITALTTQVYSVFIRATPEQVWDAITKPEFTQQYFFGASIEVRDGRRFAAVSDSVWDEEVLEEDPPHKLVHGWISAYDSEMAAEAESRVTWEIEPQDGGITQADRRARPARGRAEDGGERRRRLDVRPQRPEDAAGDRQAARRLSRAPRPRPSEAMSLRRPCGLYPLDSPANTEERTDAEDTSDRRHP